MPVHSRSSLGSGVRWQRVAFQQHPRPGPISTAARGTGTRPTYRRKLLYVTTGPGVTGSQMGPDSALARRTPDIRSARRYARALRHAPYPYTTSSSHRVRLADGRTPRSGLHARVLDPGPRRTSSRPQRSESAVVVHQPPLFSSRGDSPRPLICMCPTCPNAAQVARGNATTIRLREASQQSCR